MIEEKLKEGGGFWPDGEAGEDTIRDFENFFALSQDMFCIAGVDGYFKRINQSFERILGYTKKELLEQSFIELVHPEDKKRTQDELVKLDHGQPTIRFENRYRCKDGDYKWLAWTSTPASGGGIVYAVARDITSQKTIEEEHRRNQAFLNSIVDNIPNMIFVKDASDLRFVRFNKAGEELLGFTQDEIIGKNDYDFFSIEKADFFTHKDREVLKEKKLIDIPEESIQTRYRGERVLHTKKIPLYDQHENPEYLLGISEDITDQKIMEANVMRALVEGQDKERKRIAEDLHDSIGQKLSAIKLNCNSLESESTKFSLKNKEVYENLKVLLKETVEEIRNISHNLMPGTLQDFGLKLALMDLCDKINKSGDINLKFQSHGKLRLNKTVEMGIYRIAQELINNALKHSKAHEINVQLFFRDDKIILSVDDDGIGFDVKSVNYNSTFGINSIISRTKGLCGTFTVESREGSGTLATAEIPAK